jgi:hypothetical protein
MSKQEFSRLEVLLRVRVALVVPAANRGCHFYIAPTHP